MSASVDVKCPHCGGKSFTVYERMEVAHVFEVVEGEAKPMMRSEGFGIQLGFSATCRCGHHWIPRTRTARAVMDAEEYARETMP